jgi:hypothetical protein
MKYFFLIPLTFLFSVSYGQDSLLSRPDTALFLQSWYKPKKIDKITNDLLITVALNLPDTIGKAIPQTYDGLLLYSYPDRIVMTVNHERLTLKNFNGSKTVIEKSYSFVDSLKKISDGEIRTIHKNNIKSISHFTIKRASNVSGAIAMISAVTALFIAPLVSIDYKTGNFRQGIYYPTLAACGSGFVVGLTFNMAFRKNKFYAISQYAPEPDGDTYFHIK